MPNNSPATEARRWVAALRASHEHLTGLVGDHDSDQLRGPSYCDEWTVAQVLSHLGSAAEINRRGLDAISGGEAPDQSANQEIWDRWNAKSPDEQARDALTADADLVARWEAFDDEQLAGFSATMFGMQLDAVAVAGMRLGEHILHTWDIEVMRDADAVLPSEAAGLVAGRLPMMAGYFGKADRRVGGPIRWVLQTSDPERRFLLEVDEGVRLTENEAAEGDGEVALAAEAFDRLVSGRLDPDHTPPGVEVSGLADLDELRRIFPGY